MKRTTDIEGLEQRLQALESGGAGDVGPDLSAIEALTGSGLLERVSDAVWQLRSNIRFSQLPLMEGPYLLGQSAAGTGSTSYISVGSGLTLSGGILELSASAGLGTVTSVSSATSGAGLTTSGGPITGSGTLTYALADDVAAIEALSGTGIARRTGSNTWTVGGGVTLAEMASMTDARLLGRSAGSSGVPQEISIGSGLSLSGGTLSATGGGGSGTVTSVNGAVSGAGLSVSGGPITGSGTLTYALADDVAAIEALSGTGIARRTGSNTWTVGGGVTLAEMASMTDARLLGRSAGSSGIPQEISIGSGLSLSGGTLSATTGGGDVGGPSSATDNALALFDGTTGKLIKKANISFVPGDGLHCDSTGEGFGYFLSLSAFNYDFKDPYGGPYKVGIAAGFPALTADRIQSLQDANGVIALTSDIPAYHSGTATLSSGYVRVTHANTPAVGAGNIQLTCQSPGGAVGTLYISARSAGAWFDIQSTSVGDSSVVGYDFT